MKKASKFLELVRLSSDSTKDNTIDIIFESLSAFFAYVNMCYKVPDYNVAVKLCDEVIKLRELTCKEHYENRFTVTPCMFYQEFSFEMDSDLKDIVFELTAIKIGTNYAKCAREYMFVVRLFMLAHYIRLQCHIFKGSKDNIIAKTLAEYKECVL